MYFQFSMWTRSRISPSRLLSEILDFMRSRISSQSNLKWNKQNRERDSQADLEYHAARYEDAINEFNVRFTQFFRLHQLDSRLFCHHNQKTILLDIPHTVAKLPDHDTARRDIREPASRNLKTSVSSSESDQDVKAGGITPIFSCLLF